MLFAVEWRTRFSHRLSAFQEMLEKLSLRIKQKLIFVKYSAKCVHALWKKALHFYRSLQLTELTDLLNLFPVHFNKKLTSLKVLEFLLKGLEVLSAKLTGFFPELS